MRRLFTIATATGVLGIALSLADFDYPLVARLLVAVAAATCVSAIFATQRVEEWMVHVPWRNALVSMLPVLVGVVTFAVVAPKQDEPPLRPAAIQTPPAQPTPEEYAAAVVKALPKPEAPKPAVVQKPSLTDRYIESWFPGEQGNLLIYEGSHLPTYVGKHQMFTPGIRAPESTALSSVTFSMCVPTHFKWDPNKEWVLQDTNLCAPNHARYTTHFSQPIPRGGGLNPREAFWFWPTQEGEELIKYWITNVELPPFESYFFVNVAAKP